MNERIRKLIFESVRFDLDPDSNHYEAQIDPEDLEDFAELIVRECAKVARNADLEDVEGGDSSVLYAAAEQIKKHFGFEE
jgi:hypothetical protein